MKRTNFAIALALLTAAITVTFLVNRPVPVAASTSIQETSESLLYGSADALVLSCMDYRLTDETAGLFQRKLGMRNKYDYVILAGASLGVNNTTYPNWGETFWQHLDTAISLHGIHEVIVVDHRNCGAYKLLLGKDFPAHANASQLKEETAVHKAELDRVANKIHTNYPKLEVETMLMGLDGRVEKIGHINGEPKPGDKH